MAVIQNFRSALGGFNRQDVVRYIEYLNNQHNAQIEQLNTQLQNARDALANAPAPNEELQAQLEAAQARCAELEAILEGNGQTVLTPTETELEAYRRAERAERLARERASQLYQQANAVLADATVRVEAASDSLSNISQQLSQQIQQSRQSLQEATAAMYAIRPAEDE